MSRLRELTKLGVVPGDSVCVVEEFLPGAGVYEDGGVIRASTVGLVSVDLRSRVINVKSTKTPHLPTRGEVVYALVTVLHEELAITRIFASELGRKYVNHFTGLLHVSQVHEKFVRSINEVLAVGDVIKAKILNDSIPYTLSVKEARLGVMLAYCSLCGTQLRRQSTDSLRCPKCDNVEKRKLSLDYSTFKFKF